MIKKTLIIGLVFSFVPAVFAQYKTISHIDSNGFTYEQVENDPSNARVYTLKNGLKVYLAQNKDKPSIQTYIPVRTGSNNDPSDNTGLAHYLEHMLFKGTSNLGTINWEQEQILLQSISDLYEQHKQESDVVVKAQIYKKIDSLSKVASSFTVANEYDKAVSMIGATGTNAHTWFEETVYQNTIPSNELEKFLIVEKERFSELVLRLFHTELEAVYEEFNRSQDNDGFQVNTKMLGMLFPSSNYGQQSTIGTSEHLKNPSMIAIKNYYDTYYVANNMAVVLVGDLEFEPTISLVNKYMGQLKSGPQPKEYVAKEVTLTKAQVAEVFSPQSERVQIGYRLDGAKSQDALYLNLIDMLLSNGTAGLIDLDINQKQKALYGASQAMIMKDYSVHFLAGAPNEGQTIEQVETLLLDQINKIKKGDFEPWLLQAVVNEVKKYKMQGLESNSAMSSQMYEAFIQGRTWQEVVSELNQLEKITKEDIITFANTKYKDNYAVVYKRQGENKDLVRVENPGITPIDLNRESASKFIEDFQKIEVTPIKPVFVDFQNDIKKEIIGKNKSSMYSIQNTTNDLASLAYIVPIGTDNDKKLELAIDYMNYLGTDKYSAEDIKKEFYRLGVNYNIRTGTDRSFVTISGLTENIIEGIKLVEHLTRNAVVDKQAYANLVDQLLKVRKDNKTSKSGIAYALNAYAKSAGEKNRFNDVLSEQQLLAIEPQELVDLVRDIFNYNQDVFYYGNQYEGTKKAVEKFHDLGKNKVIAKPTLYNEPASRGEVYFAPYDMVQAEITFTAREALFDKNLISDALLFNNYFGSGMASVVFQEIRESQSLAYSAYANYSRASKKDRHNYLVAYVGTQSNKLGQAVGAMLELMNNMPVSKNQFAAAKSATMKNLAAQRYTKAQIFYYWLQLQDLGIDHDINKEIYNEINSMDISTLEKFFNQHIKAKTYNVGLLGKKDNIDWESIRNLGPVKETSLEQIFGY